jgi:endoglucanase
LDSEKKQITDRLNEAAAWSARTKIPVMMGEFGTIELAGRESRLRWTAFVAREAEKRNIGWVYWQFCSNFAAYSCETGQWDAELLGALIPVNTSN